MKSFVAIDFETATGYRNSCCSVGIVSVENGIIVDEFHSLIQPPGNEYWYQNIRVHGIEPEDTAQVGSFDKVYPEIRKRLLGKNIVAHNESFDRGVLKSSMELYNLNYSELSLPEKWDCTMKIYRQKGFAKANLSYCCNIMNIELNHHEALSDARACALLFLKK